MNVLTGIYKPTAGQVFFAGGGITGRTPAQIALGGIARTFQNVQLFGEMTATENILVGLHHSFRSNVFDAMLHTPRRRREERAARERAAAILHFVGLADLADEEARNLPYGKQRLLEIGRALALDPRLLLLDEPTTGLDPQARHLIWERLQWLLQQGKAILLTTHFMDEAERLCSRLLVLDHGRKIAEGRPRELIAEHLEPEVVEAYGNGALGLAHDAALRPLAGRTEVSGDTVFFYTHDARPLLQALAAHSHLRTLHRPANLEDLFLKLTGRQIRTDG